VTTGPVEPPPSPWRFPDPTDAPDDLVCVGADLEPGTLLAAYRAGLFPMPYDRRRLGWWSPDPRGVLPLDGLRVSRSLRRSTGRSRR
jgi:leucyl/phenylalanyl-tRNA--protein transferase